MKIANEHREHVRYRLAQAQEAYDEAKGLLAAGAEPHYVANSLFYAFYYPALALLRARGAPAAMQSVSISLFERECVDTGLVDRRVFWSLRKAFELKPKCSTAELTLIEPEDVEGLFGDAKTFIETIRRDIDASGSAEGQIPLTRAPRGRHGASGL